MLTHKTSLYTGLTITLAFWIQGCSSVNEKDLYGTYLAEYPFGTEKLTLNEGGKYIQEISVKDPPQGKPKTQTHKGHWRYNPSDKYVDLENALHFGDPSDSEFVDYNVPVDGIVLAQVTRTFPDIRLSTGYEDIDFVKIK